MYTDFYEFSEKPFEDNPDPKFLYLTPSYQEASASILTWIREGQGFSAITGEAGTGKTYFTRTLVNHISEKVKTIIISYPATTFKELLKRILLGLDQPVLTETVAGLFRRLTGFLDQLMTEDKTLLIIFDEAQSLDDKTLEGISRFLDLRSKPIRIIFVGQPQFDERVSSPGLSELGKRIQVKHRIKSFTEEESREYIDHRLRLVGSRSQIFTPRAISMICTYTQGVPGLINHVCDNAFRVGFTMNQREIDMNIIEEVIQNLSGPGMPRKIQRSIPVRQIRWSPIRFPTSFRIPIAILFLVFLAGVFFLFYEYPGRRTMNIQGIKSTHKPSVERKIESILTEDRTSRSDESKLMQPESSPVHQGAVFLTHGMEKQHPVEIKVVEKGEFLFSLAKKYYDTANTTLVSLILDFNPEITNANLILLKQKIKMPKIAEELLIVQQTDYTYKIHVGTFQSSSYVRFFVNEPILKGKAVEIFPRKVSPQETWYRVVVGPFDHKEECLKVIAQLKEKEILPVFGGILRHE